MPARAPSGRRRARWLRTGWRARWRARWRAGRLPAGRRCRSRRLGGRRARAGAGARRGCRRRGRPGRRRPWRRGRWRRRRSRSRADRGLGRGSGRGRRCSRSGSGRGRAGLLIGRRRGVRRRGRCSDHTRVRGRWLGRDDGRSVDLGKDLALGFRPRHRHREDKDGRRDDHEDGCRVPLQPDSPVLEGLRLHRAPGRGTPGHDDPGRRHRVSSRRGAGVGTILEDSRRSRVPAGAEPPQRGLDALGQPLWGRGRAPHRRDAITPSAADIETAQTRGGSQSCSYDSASRASSANSPLVIAKSRRPAARPSPRNA